MSDLTVYSANAVSSERDVTMTSIDSEGGKFQGGEFNYPAPLDTLRDDLDSADPDISVF